MNIAIDIDQVLFDLVTPLSEKYKEKFGKELNGIKDFGFNFVSKEEKDYIHEILDDETFLHSLNPIEDAKFKLMLLRSYGYNLFIISNRPEKFHKKTVEMISEYYPKILSDNIFLIGKSSKRNVMEELGIYVIIDDSPKVIEDCMNGNLLIFMVTNEKTVYNHYLRDNKRITCVPSIKEVILEIY